MFLTPCPFYYYLFYRITFETIFLTAKDKLIDWIYFQWNQMLWSQHRPFLNLWTPNTMFIMDAFNQNVNTSRIFFWNTGLILIDKYQNLKIFVQIISYIKNYSNIITLLSLHSKLYKIPLINLELSILIFIGYIRE